MKDFAELYARLDQTTRTNPKVAAMADYFASPTVPDADKLWTVALFSGRRPRRTITATACATGPRSGRASPSGFSRSPTASSATFPRRSRSSSPPPPRKRPARSPSGSPACASSPPCRSRAPRRHPRCLGLPPRPRAVPVHQAPDRQLPRGRIPGPDDQGPGPGHPPARGDVAHRLMGAWTPETTTWDGSSTPARPRRQRPPLPFYLAYQLDDPADLGDPADWFAEMKWDGIRGQLILREGRHHLGPRRGPHHRPLPEMARALDWLPPAPCSTGRSWPGARAPPYLQRPPAPHWAQDRAQGAPRYAPVVLMAYDLLEEAGQDIRQPPSPSAAPASNAS
jgi:DNA ligase-1